MSRHDAPRTGGPPRRLRGLTEVYVAGLLAGTALVLSARWTWLGELAASFAWHLGMCALGAVPVLLVLRARRLALVALALGALHAGPELLLWLPSSRAGAAAPTESGTELDVATCNLLWGNRDRRGFVEWVERRDPGAPGAPDVLVCLEVSPAWRAALEGLADRYPHRLYAPDGPWNSGTWGTAILSRLPFAEARLLPVEGRDQRPIMEAVLVLGGRRLLLRGAHPMRPGLAWRTAMRDEVFDALAGQEWPAASLLLGDLNVTSTSPAFRRLLTATGLCDSRRGFGRQPSYTTTRHVPGLAIAIDHVLVGADVQVLERRTEVLPGSDHRIVRARVALRPLD